MDDERFLVTGASGCIGAWVVRNLVRGHLPTLGLTLRGDLHRLELVMEDSELARCQLAQVDIADLDGLERAMAGFGPTHVIHLAALQLPFCRADPALGARVNVLGTVHVFEAAKRAGLRRVVYASSAAVYGPAAEYPAGPLAHDAPLDPGSHYGVYKQANEGSARIYWQESGISSIGLRPYVVYGAGRDQGMTSTPTQAMLAAAAGRPYTISYGGRFGFQYADDVARTFISAARCDFQGAAVFNIGGDTVSVPEIIAAIEAVEPASRGQITYTDTPLPFPAEIDGRAVWQLLGPLPVTPLATGVAETIAIFRAALAAGRIAGR